MFQQGVQWPRAVPVECDLAAKLGHSMTVCQCTAGSTPADELTAVGTS
jgi:hypothetical protein